VPKKGGKGEAQEQSKKREGGIGRLNLILGLDGNAASTFESANRVVPSQGEKKGWKDAKMRTGRLEEEGILHAALACQGKHGFGMRIGKGT